MIPLALQSPVYTSVYHLLTFRSPDLPFPDPHLKSVDGMPVFSNGGKDSFNLCVVAKVQKTKIQHLLAQQFLFGEVIQTTLGALPLTNECMLFCQSR